MNHAQPTRASIILAQLGGSRFCAMTGASNILDGGDYLQFRIGRNAKRVNHVRVTITPEDLYTVETFSTRRYTSTTLASVDLVPADALRATFENLTGLYTSL